MRILYAARRSALHAVIAMTRDKLLDLFELHAPDLRRFLTSRVECADTAADLTQETYLRLAQAPGLNKIQNVRVYLFRIAANLAIDHVRALSRRSAVHETAAELLELPDAAATPEGALLAKEELQVVEDALSELSPLCQRIFWLNRFERLSHGEIASRLHVCKSTVEKNLARALNHCRRRLNGA